MVVEALVVEEVVVVAEVVEVSTQCNVHRGLVVYLTNWGTYNFDFIQENLMYGIFDSHNVKCIYAVCVCVCFCSTLHT